MRSRPGRAGAKLLIDIPGIWGILRAAEMRLAMERWCELRQHDSTRVAISTHIGPPLVSLTSYLLEAC
jgi:hypothetical protein